MKTIAQQLGVTDFPFIIKDKQGNEIYYEIDGFWSKKEYDSENKEIYCEDSSGFWWKRKFDSNGNIIYFENSREHWEKWEYDSQGNEIYFEDSNGSWGKCEFDSAGNEIYYENSDGKIIDNRPKEDTESTLRIREFFRQLRLKTHHHLGLGAIKLTLEDQEELCELVEVLINKTTDQ